MVDDISRAARAVHIGQDTMRIALQSIWLGIAFSVVLMLIAAFGVIPATVGAGLQEVVDLADDSQRAAGDRLAPRPGVVGACGPGVARRGTRTLTPGRRGGAGQGHRSIKARQECADPGLHIVCS